ncbi:MAG: sensor histidine kinase [Bacteroidota bacterium]
MTRSLGKPRTYWAAYIIAALVVLMAILRIQTHFVGTPARGLALLALGLFSVLFLIEFLLSWRVPWSWTVYFALQIGCLQFAATLQPFLDVVMSLYLPLGVQVFYYLPRRTAYFWAVVFAVLLTVTLTRALGPVEGLAHALMLIAEGIIMTTFALLVVWSQKEREESQALVTRLQEAQRRLQEHTAQAAQLVAERERNRLARELHDSVGQMIFSIELTCESARLMLERDPAQVPALLDQLQGMTEAALGRLRSIISDLRPHS